VTGFKSRAGKNFRSRLALMQTEEGRWRVEFDEPWAKEGAKPPEADDAAATENAAAAAGGVSDEGQPQAA
jgi:DNA topoisomerase III